MAKRNWLMAIVRAVFDEPEPHKNLHSSEFERKLEAAALLRDLVAQLEVAHAYSYGDGVVKDEREAAKWWRAAAEQGSRNAQVKMGYIYTLGQGVAKDPRRGIEWFRKAAERGVTEAQINLGDAYSTGSGVDKDPQKAVEWWRQAAEQCEPNAQIRLSNAYRLGEGVTRDYREAAIWALVAKLRECELPVVDETIALCMRELPESEWPSLHKEAASRNDKIVSDYERRPHYNFPDGI